MKLLSIEISKIKYTIMAVLTIPGLIGITELFNGEIYIGILWAAICCALFGYLFERLKRAAIKAKKREMDERVAQELKRYGIEMLRKS